jgi:hypothetical protein
MQVRCKISGRGVCKALLNEGMKVNGAKPVETTAVWGIAAICVVGDRHAESPDLRRRSHRHESSGLKALKQAVRSRRAAGDADWLDRGCDCADS